MDTESVTWLVVGALAAAFITQRHMAIEKARLPEAPSAQREVDPTRWRHDGSQRMEYADGNKSKNADQFYKEWDLVNALAF